MKFFVLALLLTSVVFGACQGVCSHEYVGKTLTSPDCTVVGEKEYVCSKCNHTYVEKLDILWHESDSKGNCIRCDKPIEQNLYYQEIKDKEEYRIAGVLFGRTVNDDMIIPTTYNDLPITEIAEHAFKGADLKIVRISPTVKNIREGAFMQSLVQVVECPLGLTGIGKDAFKNCYLLKEITIYSSLMVVGENAFSDCLSLETVNFYGSREDFDKMNVMAGNDAFINATITFINN